MSVQTASQQIVFLVIYPFSAAILSDLDCSVTWQRSSYEGAVPSLIKMKFPWMRDPRHEGISLHCRDFVFGKARLRVSSMFSQQLKREEPLQPHHSIWAESVERTAWKQQQKHLHSMRQEREQNGKHGCKQCWIQNMI